ncbi:MAG: hypothetical protein A2068_01155 [Ignavibacteria bacterium GWB2_35_6b]|nr:MAG: hypothetical protein A2068_01155 [Ignavibacteria bacterium GWB2_35_6b]
MNYKLVYTKRAVKDIINLDARIKSRIKKNLEMYSKSPFKHSEKLTNHEIGTYRFRVGDYRTIFDLHKDKIVVLRVGHRREIYRKL